MSSSDQVPAPAQGDKTGSPKRLRRRIRLNGTGIRMKPAVRKVLAAVTDAPEPLTGLAICQQTGLGTGTVYPALDRLMRAALIRDEWTDAQPPPRGSGHRLRLYHPAFAPQWYRQNGLLPPPRTPEPEAQG